MAFLCLHDHREDCKQILSTYRSFQNALGAGDMTNAFIFMSEQYRRENAVAVFADKFAFIAGDPTVQSPFFRFSRDSVYFAPRTSLLLVFHVPVGWVFEMRRENGTWRFAGLPQVSNE